MSALTQLIIFALLCAGIYAIDYCIAHMDEMHLISAFVWSICITIGLGVNLGNLLGG